MSLTQGVKPVVKTGPTRRRLAAGEAKRGGVLRKTATVHGSSCGWVRWRALALPHRMVVVAVPRVAGDDGNELDGGDRRRACVEKWLQGPKRCVRSTVRIYVLW